MEQCKMNEGTLVDVVAVHEATAMDFFNFVLHNMFRVQNL
jgi:hypothetical protein